MTGTSVRKLDPKTKVHYVCVKNRFFLERDYQEKGPFVDFVMRLFDSPDDAVRYAETVVEYEMEKSTDVTVETNFVGNIISMAFKEGPRIKKREGESLRVDYSRMPPEEHPSTTSILYRYQPKPRYTN
jgi:hypothetical protein